MGRIGRCIQCVGVGVLLFACIVFIRELHIYITATRPVFYSALDASNDEVCSIHVLDPFDPSIQRFLRDPEPLDCNLFPSIVYLDDNNVLRFNKSAFKFFQINSSDSDISCTGQSVYKSEDPFNVVLGTPYSLRLPAELNSDFNFVQCKHGNTVVFYNCLAGISDERDATKPEIKDETDEQLSVYVIGLDSVSRSASIRSLPKTLEYLRTLGSHDFRGYIKIGDNTPPNLFGLLTGKVLSADTRVRQPTYLWNNFTDRHYTTLFAQDILSSYLFLNSFQDVQTDHYFRTFWLGLKTRKSSLRLLNKRKTTKFCQQNTKTFMVTLNYLKRFMTHYNRKRKFSFTMLSKVSHDDINYLSYLDKDLTDFLRWLKEEGFLTRSMVVLFGDHGPRYGSIRDTPVGRIESKMPLLHVLLPEHIKTRYPEVDANLQINTQRLVTLYDVHQTLLDVLSNKYGNPSTQIVNGKPRGRSLFKEISRSRSCNDADIPPEFCACYNMSRLIDLKHNHAFDAAGGSIVDHINAMLTTETNCKKLKLNKVLSAEKIPFKLHRKDTVDSNGLSVLRFFKPAAPPDIHAYHIRVQTEPGSAIFDVTCELDSEGRTNSVHNVERTNAYGNQSHCVTDETLRQFCYC